MNNIRMFGGTGCVLTAAAGVEHQFYSYECAFNAAAATIAGGLRIASRPAIVVHQRSVSNDNWLDGFNYHGVASSTTRSECPKVIEIDCNAERNGNDNGGANNASTAHEASQVIRLRTASGASDGRKYASAADRASTTFRPRCPGTWACASRHRAIVRPETLCASAAPAERTPRKCGSTR
jgi:hypothetical protein